MTQIPTTQGNPQASEIAVESALPLLGSATREDGQTVLTTVDSDLARLYEDRNAVLAEGGTITYNGSTLTFTSNLKLHINSRVGGGSPVAVDLGSTTRTIDTDGDMIYAVINRTAGTATVTDNATTLPSVVAANKEVFLIAKRVSGTIYFRNGFVMNSGDSTTLGVPATTGNVNASANITDNAVVRGDGGATGVQDSGVTLDDNDRFSDVVSTGKLGNAKTSTGSYSVPSNYAYYVGNYTIDTGHTVTVDSSGDLIALGSLTITGTLTVNGTFTIIS